MYFCIIILAYIRTYTVNILIHMTMCVVCGTYVRITSNRSIWCNENNVREYLRKWVIIRTHFQQYTTSYMSSDGSGIITAQHSEWSIRVASLSGMLVLHFSWSNSHTYIRTYMRGKVAAENSRSKQTQQMVRVAVCWTARIFFLCQFLKSPKSAKCGRDLWSTQTTKIR